MSLIERLSRPLAATKNLQHHNDGFVENAIYPALWKS